jgi:VWFA-related protein
MRIVVYAFLLAAAFAALAVGQDAETIRVETQLVDVPVIVTDRSGRALTGLGRENFKVSEDGVLQQIAEFRTTAAPFNVAVLLDTSGSTRSDLETIRRAAASFIASLRRGDRVSVIAFRTERTEKAAYSVSEVVVGLTDDRSTLEAALERVSTSNSTPFFDGLRLALDGVFGGRTKSGSGGRRALVALSDGVDSSSSTEFEEIRYDLEEAGVISYFVKIDTREFFESNLLGDCSIATRFSVAQIRRYYDTYYPKSKVERVYDFCKIGDFERLAISKGLYDLADQQMDLLARVSGGRVFPIGGLGDARTAFRAVADEIGIQYSLGYYSSNDKRDGAFRRIKVELRNAPPGTVVRAREGYEAK